MNTERITALAAALTAVNGRRAFYSERPRLSMILPDYVDLERTSQLLVKAIEQEFVSMCIMEDAATSALSSPS